MIKIGITGGIGSGKTTVAQLLSLFGITIYNSDQEGKRLMNQDPQVIKQIKQLFGETAYRNGSLDSNHIAQIVFKNREALEQLNAIVHPAVISDFQQWATSETREIVGIESAILFECNISHHLDFTIGVVAPLDQRIKRVGKRSNLPPEAIAERIDKQMDDATMKSRCDFIVLNNDRLSIIQQTNTIVQQIRNSSKL